MIDTWNPGAGRYRAIASLSRSLHRLLWKPALLLGVTLLSTSCNKTTGNPAPPKNQSPAALPQQTSTIVVPITVNLADLEAGLNRQTPQILWRIDEFVPQCVPAQRLKVFGKKLKVTPTLHCRIAGQVTRGRISLSGSGKVLKITMPIRAAISAKNVGGIIKQKTATGAAIVRAQAKLSVDRTWSPAAKVQIDYDWTDPPGIDFLGQRIRFTSKADAKLKSVVAKLEQDLPKELAKLRMRDRLQGLWKQGFASILLNRERPPVWMRVTPRKLGFDGYRVVGRKLEMTLAAEALTETFVGDRPSPATPTALPPPSPRPGAKGLRFFIPVLADYVQLEPVVERTLGKLAKKGITLTGIGPVDAEFGKVTIYATDGERMAVGIQAKVQQRGGLRAATSGEIWLSATPFNEPNSQRVAVRDLKIAGQTDSRAVNLLFSLFEDPVVLERIRTSLTHDFGGDYEKVLVAARKAIAGHREGDFVFAATVSTVTNGTLKVTGEGLFMPVQAYGQASIRYQPR
ncbi:MAG: DUF4403 family protein [Pseudomonadota bacterium]